MGHFETWRERFRSTHEFFGERYREASELGNRMMNAILEDVGDEEA
jgi:prephenate dehydrogenase (NADP+)